MKQFTDQLDEVRLLKQRLANLHELDPFSDENKKQRRKITEEPVPIDPTLLKPKVKLPAPMTFIEVLLRCKMDTVNTIKTFEEIGMTDPFSPD